MSDSEYYVRKNVNTAKSSHEEPAHRFATLDSDDDERVSIRGTPKSKSVTKKIAAAPKRKSKASNAPAPAPKRATLDNERQAFTEVFDSGDESEARSARSIALERANLTSALSRRVADGVLRRYQQLEGNLFVEVRVYNTADIAKVDPRNRHEKASVSLKYRVSDDSPELESLRNFLKEVKKKFTEEGKFFADRK